MMQSQTSQFTADTKKQISFDYLTYLPADYDPAQPASLVIFLHGRGERGPDLERVKLHGLPYEIENGRDLPAIVVAPQCPGDTYWPHELPALSAFLDQLLQDYNIDEDRIYLTGLSMGGYGTWWWALEEPERFAAIAPVCGGGDSDRVSNIAHLPIWAFHGDADDIVAVRATTRLIEALEAIGAEKTRVTIYPGVGHNSWAAAYSTEELYDWLFAQKRTNI